MAHDHSAHRHQVDRRVDVAIVGGSAAGLAAALTLVRSSRSVIVVDAGEPRNAPAHHMHNFLGFDGAPPTEYLAIARREVRSYGGEILTGRVEAVVPGHGGFQVETDTGIIVTAQRAIAATGVVDELPDIPGLRDGWGDTVIHCPFCHGYEARDGRLVVIATASHAPHVAAMFRHLSRDITVVVHGDVGVEAFAELTAAGVEVVNQRVDRVESRPGDVSTVRLADGAVLDADTVVVTPTWSVRAEPFVGLETIAHPSGVGRVVDVDDMGRTSVPGLHAAGNITDPSLQVMPAAAHGSRVGAFVHAVLVHDELTRDAANGDGDHGSSVDWDARYESDEQLWSGNPNGTLVAEVSDLPAGRALDIGAGEGGDAVWLAERGWSVTATDVSEVALDRGRRVSTERGLDIDWRLGDLRVDAPEPSAFDLVSLQYPAVPRSGDGRGLRHLLDAVAPGGTLLVVGHSFGEHDGPAAWDVHAYLQPAEVAAAIADDESWAVEFDGERERPGGHVHDGDEHVGHGHRFDAVLRARRRAG